MGREKTVPILLSPLWLQRIFRGVFGRPAELRNSHLNIAQSTICCLLDRRGLSRHCRPHTKMPSQLGLVGKLKSSFATELGRVDPAKHCSGTRRPPDPHPPTSFSSHFPHHYLSLIASSCRHLPPEDDRRRRPSRPRQLAPRKRHLTPAPSSSPRIPSRLPTSSRRGRPSWQRQLTSSMP
jgi:hypothetical protein